jgi:hypothetical protein
MHRRRCFDDNVLACRGPGILLSVYRLATGLDGLGVVCRDLPLQFSSNRVYFEKGGGGVLRSYDTPCSCS